MMDNADFQFERVLSFKRAGEVQQGRATIGGLKFLENKQKWACRVAIDYLFSEPAWLEGDDPLDAFNHCLLFLSDIVLGNTEKGWSVWWQQEGDHGKFVDYA